MARDRKSALAASIHAERTAVQARVPTFDKFERAEAALSGTAMSPTAAAPRTATKSRAMTDHRRLVEKVIRDSFTMPVHDYEKISQLQAKCLKLGISVTKSEILRAGLHALERLSSDEIRVEMRTVEKIKPGRPGRG